MRTTKITYSTVKPIEKVIFTIRAEKVILDADLAATYGVETKELNRAVKRNAHRFPDDFVFQLTAEEVANLRCQIGTPSFGGTTMRCQFGTASKRNVRYRPFVFTEQGAIMAANVLRSPWAMKMSVFVVRAFVKLRQELGQNRQFAAKLAELERKLSERLDLHEKAILQLLQQMQDLLGPAIEPAPEPKKKEIGFHVRESKGRSGVKQRRKRQRCSTSSA